MPRKTDSPATPKAAPKTKAKTKPKPAQKAGEMKAHRQEQGGNPCRPGYEPVPGKKPGTRGSCRPVGKS